MPGIAGGAACAHGEQAVGGEGLVARGDRGAGGAVVVVGESGGRTGTGLDGDVEPCLLERRHGGGHERHTPFARKRLFRDGNLHRGALLREWPRRGRHGASGVDAAKV